MPPHLLIKSGQPSGSILCGAWQLVKDHRAGWRLTVEPTGSGKLIAETGGAAFGALIGLCFAGPLGAGPGAVIGVIAQPLMERWVAKCVNEFRRRGDVLAEAASLSSGLGQDEVVSVCWSLSSSSRWLPACQTPHPAPTRRRHCGFWAEYLALQCQIARGESTKI